jgi:hypothetical protein
MCGVSLLFKNLSEPAGREELIVGIIKYSFARCCLAQFLYRIWGASQLDINPKNSAKRIRSLLQVRPV